MNIHNGSLYWPTTTAPFTPNTLYEKLDLYDAVIVGSGMSGSLTALALAEAGLSVAILDKRALGTGSTSANTGLLQYSNDIMLHELIEQIGEREAVRFYQLCYEAVDDIEKTVNRLHIDADFIRRPSICYASDEKDVEKIRTEYATLQKYGLPCDYYEQKDIEEKFPFSRLGALVTFNDAEVNPLKFVQALLKKVELMGVHLFPYVEVQDVFNENEHLELRTSGQSFHAKRIIYTTGYETTPVGNRIGADINRSYVFVSNPIENLSDWYKRALIWETKRPYLYIRSTSDGRIIAGGLDEDKPNAPLSDELIMIHAKKLLKQTENLFPNYRMKIDYAYAASFGESIDNLPFIGEHPTKRNHYYLLGYGGNGTVYSMLGSHILRDLIIGERNEDAEIVQLSRKYGIT
ncbi:NAD(P)/FAD-dependent oxidoreductase [Psychrobacillus lasiicapitis]|uniref:FAD-binding oxidoreductase n=1 Tax=Psychrobacillus lasiicapitis TaxID=1636719 RepID=A0A544T011_9BACI|nr:FAD-dependent oxidoreductase [Psychrobacillus lasiicapitis]TQR10774.1 FAD-binding oxidoreductase [Psychrobacillus lasiicapitis]GGA42566.1 oxidoreductase [Psychrobacillus lasiicapitis]